MSRVHNFSAGPAALPLQVIERIRADLPEWDASGTSVMEMSHRGKAFISIAERAEADLRALLGVPDGYHVLFLQGGAQLQFSAVPMNLLGAGSGRGHGSGPSADYVDTGAWSAKAIAEARRYCEVNVVASSEATGYDRVPAPAGWAADPEAAYLHYTPNETIGGVEFHFVPDAGAVPLVADMSSTILSRPVPVERFGLIYAGAQKNAGIAGMALPARSSRTTTIVSPAIPAFFWAPA